MIVYSFKKLTSLVVTVSIIVHKAGIVATRRDLKFKIDLKGLTCTADIVYCKLLVKKLVETAQV